MKLACVSMAPCGIGRVMNNVMCISENFEKVKSTIKKKKLKKKNKKKKKKKKSVTIYVIYVDKMWDFW
jgi:hypothetical protein